MKLLAILMTSAYGMLIGGHGRPAYLGVNGWQERIFIFLIEISNRSYEKDSRIFELTLISPKLIKKRPNYSRKKLIFFRKRTILQNLV